MKIVRSAPDKRHLARRIEAPMAQDGALCTLSSCGKRFTGSGSCKMYHAKVEVASVDEVYEAPGRANRHIHPAAQLTDLLANVHATIVAAHNQTRRGFLELALHLLCQLTRGRQDDAAGGLPTPWEAFCILLQAPGGSIRASITVRAQSAVLVRRYHLGSNDQQQAQLRDSLRLRKPNP